MPIQTPLVAADTRVESQYLWEEGSRKGCSTIARHFHKVLNASCVQLGDGYRQGEEREDSLPVCRVWFSVVYRRVRAFHRAAYAAPFTQAAVLSGYRSNITGFQPVQ